MNRRQFVSTSGAAAAALAGATTQTSDAAPKRALMKLGCQTAPTNEQHLQYLARYGVQGICGYPDICRWPPLRTPWTSSSACGTWPRNTTSRVDLHCTSFPGVEPHRSRKTSGHHAGPESAARSRYRGPADADPQLRRHGHPLHQIQPVYRGRPAHGPLAGTRRFHLQHLAIQRCASQHAFDARRPCGRRRLLGAHHVFSGPRNSGGRRT